MITDTGICTMLCLFSFSLMFILCQNKQYSVLKIHGSMCTYATSIEFLCTVQMYAHNTTSKLSYSHYRTNTHYISCNTRNIKVCKQWQAAGNKIVFANINLTGFYENQEGRLSQRGGEGVLGKK